MNKLQHPDKGTYDFSAVVMRGTFRHCLVFVDGATDDNQRAICLLVNPSGVYDFMDGTVEIPYSHLLELPESISVLA